MGGQKRLSWGLRLWRGLFVRGGSFGGGRGILGVEMAGPGLVEGPPRGGDKGPPGGEGGPLVDASGRRPRGRGRQGARGARQGARGRLARRGAFAIEPREGRQGENKGPPPSEGRRVGRFNATWSPEGRPRGSPGRPWMGEDMPSGPAKGPAGGRGPPPRSLAGAEKKAARLAWCGFVEAMTSGPPGPRQGRPSFIPPGPWSR